MDDPRAAFRGEATESLWRDLRAEVQKKGVDPHTSEDIVQESWLRTLRRRPLRELDLRGWLRVVARRLVHEQRRAQRHRVDRERAAARPDRLEAATGGQDSFLLRCVRQLASPYREVIELRYFEERDIEEIAQFLGRPPVTVRSQIKRGLDQLRARLGEERGTKRGRSYGLLGLGRLWRRGPSARGVGRTARAASVAPALAAAALVLVLGFFAMRGARAPKLSAAGGAEVAALVLDAAAEPAFVSSGEREPVRSAVLGAPAAAAELRGRVLTPAGSPLAGARVWSGSGRADEPREVARTDERGRFAVEGAALGPFLWATCEEWCDSRRLFVPSHSAEVPVELTVTGSGESVEIHVRDAEGRSVAGAHVVLGTDFLADSLPFMAASGALELPHGVQDARTDAHGFARLARPDGTEAWLAIEASDTFVHVQRLVLTEASTSFVVDMPRPAMLRGVVLDTDGRPAVGAHVVVTQHAGLGRLMDSVTTRSVTERDGAFEIRGLSGDAYLVRVGEDPLRGWGSAAREGRLDPGGVDQVELVLDDAATVRGLIVPSGALPSGRVFLSELSGRSSDRERRAADVSADGSFAFYGCDPEIGYRIDAYRAGSTAPWGWHDFARGGDEELVLTDAGGLGPPFELEFEGSLDEPLPTLVELRQAMPPLSMLATVDPTTRRARFEATPPVHYLVHALVPSLGTWVVDYVPRSEASGFRSYRMPVPARLTGQLEVPAGRIEEVEVNVKIAGFNAYGLESEARKSMRREVQVGPDGAFELELFAGTGKLHVACAGLESLRIPYELGEGEHEHFVLALEPALAVDVHVRLARRLVRSESLDLVALTPRGERAMTISYLPDLGSELEPFAFEVRAQVPHDAFEIRAATQSGQRGGVAFEPDPTGAQRLAIQLSDPPGTILPWETTKR
jgi:RNA polymerase sigma-70 factor (ECF subfamily)